MVNDLKEIIEMVYGLVVEKGFNSSREANHDLGNLIGDFVSGDDTRDCWLGLWRDYKSDLIELGYKPGW